MSMSVMSSLTMARRRRKARLRQSLHEVDIDESPESPESWINFSDSNRAICHSGFEMVTKRREANARERLRVKNLNSGFAKLRRILPTVPPNRKPSKVDTLQGAIDYIYQLEKVLEATGGIPNIKKTIDTTGHSHSRQSVTERPFIGESAVEEHQAAMIRYAPPFNNYENTSTLYSYTESISPPTGFSYHSENHLGMSRLTIPPSYVDGRIPCPSNSNGYPSPTSSVNSDDSHCSRGYLDLMNDRCTRPSPPPPATYSSMIVPISTTTGKSCPLRAREMKSSIWTSGRKSGDEFDEGSDTVNDITASFTARNTIDSDAGNSSRCFPISLSSLPPLSFLYGAT